MTPAKDEIIVSRKELSGALKQRGLRVEPSFRPPHLLEFETPSSIPFIRIVRNLRIGAYSYIGRDSEIRSATIGRFCSIARRVVMAQEEHPTTYVSSHPIAFNPQSYFSEDRYFNDIVERRPFSDRKSVDIGHDVWIGDRVIIRAGVRVGTGAVIGAGAVVVKDVEPYSIVGGVPSKVLKMRFTDTITDRLLNSSWWQYDISPLRSYLGDPERFVDEFDNLLDTLDKLKIQAYNLRSAGDDMYSIRIKSPVDGEQDLSNQTDASTTESDRYETEE